MLKCNTELNTALSDVGFGAITLDKQTTRFFSNSNLVQKQIFNCTTEPIEDLSYNLSVTKRSHKEAFRRNIDLDSFLFIFKTKTWATMQDNELFLTFKQESSSPFFVYPAPFFRAIVQSRPCLRNQEITLALR